MGNGAPIDSYCILTYLSDWLLLSEEAHLTSLPRPLPASVRTVGDEASVCDGRQEDEGGGGGRDEQEAGRGERRGGGRRRMGRHDLEINWTARHTSACMSSLIHSIENFLTRVQFGQAPAYYTYGLRNCEVKRNAFSTRHS